MENETAQAVSAQCSLADIFTLGMHIPSEGQIIFTLATILITTFVITSNVVVIKLTKCSPELKSMGPLRIFIGSMACADLFTGLVSMPATAHQYIFKEWVFGYVGCKIFITAATLAAIASAFHMCAIAIDCYIAFFYPLTHKSLEKTPWYTHSIVTVVWIFSTLISNLILIRYQGAAFCPDCRLNCSMSIAMTWLFYGNSALNPVIYTVFNFKFRRAFRKLFFK